jgi:hypothetical protein
MPTTISAQLLVYAVRKRVASGELPRADKVKQAIKAKRESNQFRSQSKYHRYREPKDRADELYWIQAKTSFLAVARGSIVENSAPEGGWVQEHDPGYWWC